MVFRNDVYRAERLRRRVEEAQRREPVAAVRYSDGLEGVVDLAFCKNH